MTRNQALVNLHPFIRLTAVVAVVGYFLWQAARGLWLIAICNDFMPTYRQIGGYNVTEIAGVASHVVAGLVVLVLVAMVITDGSDRMRGSLMIFGLFLLCETLLTGAYLWFEIGLFQFLMDYQAYPGPMPWYVPLFRILGWLAVFAAGLQLLRPRPRAIVYLAIAVLFYGLLTYTFEPPYAHVDGIRAWAGPGAHLTLGRFKFALRSGLWPLPPPWPTWVALLMALVLVTTPKSWSSRVLPGQRWREARHDE